MSFGEGDLHVENERLKEKVAELEADVDRVKVVNGELCDEINRQERRIRELESLARDMYRTIGASKASVMVARTRYEYYAERMRELGIEVR